MSVGDGAVPDDVEARLMSTELMEAVERLESSETAEIAASLLDMTSESVGRERVSATTFWSPER